jgi:hypothetical protein
VQSGGKYWSSWNGLLIIDYEAPAIKRFQGLLTFFKGQGVLSLDFGFWIGFIEDCRLSGNRIARYNAVKRQKFTGNLQKTQGLEQ